MDQQVISQLLHRANNTNKYDYGHVLVIGVQQTLLKQFH
jgi:NAD(P)H-hydrate repair Nnr-like enzyme with NAD(P)H-hydrate dehydratase domain